MGAESYLATLLIAPSSVAISGALAREPAPIWSGFLERPTSRTSRLTVERGRSRHSGLSQNASAALAVF
jgi:hypothetical protein